VTLVTVVTDLESSAAHPWIEPPPPPQAQAQPRRAAPARARLLASCCSRARATDAYAAAAADGACAELTGPPCVTRHVLVAGGARLQAQAAAAAHPAALLVATGGMVVHPAYYAEGRASAGSAPTAPPAARRRVVVFFGGYAPARTLRIADGWLRAYGGGATLDLVVICGRNRALLDALRAKIARAAADAARAPTPPTAGAAAHARAWAEGVRVEGFLPPDAIARHIDGAACVVGKPGPGSVSEAAVLGTPFVTECHRARVMAQEACVLAWLEASSCGLVVDDLERPPRDLLDRLGASAAALGAYDNRAVFQVAALVRQALLADERPAAERPGNFE
jgi:hypothetical protein